MAHRCARSLLLLMLVGCGYESRRPGPLVFAAVEGEGRVAVLSAETGEVHEHVDLTERGGNVLRTFAPHNVQVDEAAEMVWVSAPPHTGAGHEHGHGGLAEQLVGVAVRDLGIRVRIELGTGLHVAHVVTHRDQAYVTAFESDAILVVDLAARRVLRRLELPAGTGPHGLRASPDGETLVVAGLKGQSLLLVSTSSGVVEAFQLPCGAVQTALLPDGSSAFATLYDTRQVVRLELSSRRLELWDLPAGSAGPAQLYPTPDGRHLWLADQGGLNGDPPGNRLLRIDARTGTVDLIATVGQGPHGVVVSGDGSRVWTTLLIDGSVEAVDARTGGSLFSHYVGRNPNGITWVAPAGRD